MPLAFSYGAERAPNLVVVSARWCWWTQWSKVAVVDNAVSQSLRTKVAMLGSLRVADAAVPLVWCRKDSRRGGHGRALLVVDAVVKGCSCG